jgi:hypothetical protein
MAQNPLESKRGVKPGTIRGPYNLKKIAPIPELIKPGTALKPVDPEAQALVVQELKAQIQILEAAIKVSQDPYVELKELADVIRVVQRAVKGMGAEEDVFQGLINVKDIRERTRLDEAGILSHSAMRIASNEWPELSTFLKIAEMEDPYFISEDGEGRKEGILLQQAKTGTDRNNLVLNMPNTAGGPAQDPSNPAPPPHKKSILDKVLRRK